jgi:thiol:disulfide interchange protein DsbD
MHRLSALALSFSVLISAAWAQFELPGAAPASKSSLISEAKTIAPGAAFTVALSLSHPDKWHSYYRNSGGLEQSLAIEWKLPEGFSAGPIQWPTPDVKDGFFGKSFIYSGNPVFLVEITAPPTIKPGETVTLTANAAWQICEESCLNETATLTLTRPVGAELEKHPTATALFAQARASQPAQPAGWTFTATPDGDGILLRVKPAGALDNDPTDFVPDQPFVQSASSGGSIRRDGDAWAIRLKRATKDAIDNDIPQGDSFSGVLIGPKPVAVPETPISAAQATAKPAPVSLPFSKFLPILGGMFLGGLILNLMPCVFPVIGLKIMGFVQQAGSDRKKIALHGVTFALGVLASFGVLSAFLFTARATTGWGYQLQDPWIVVTLMILMFVLALNMYGVFEMGASATSVGGSLQSKQGLAGSFFSGVLATIVATPCSGPFLGVAIGAAFNLPAIQFFSAFAAMAVGLALPYLILSIFPHLIDSLPRPGPWMESFKQAMSFLLFATAGYLLWVYAGLIDLDNLLNPIIGLSAIAVAAWIHGRWNLPHRTRRTRTIALALTILFAVSGFMLAKPPAPSAIKWETWSQERVDSLLSKGTPVYIDFTAKWCATCQVNKKRAYTNEVVAMMNRKKVVALKADKTKPDPEIEAALQKLGRSAIPVNVLLAPGKEPVILPELLSPDHVLDALKKL